MTTLSPPAPAGAAEACCAPATGGALDDEAAHALSTVFKALGDPARVKLVSIIAAAPDGEACVCDMTAPVGLSQPTVSHHMGVLVRAGLVTREQRGRWAYYALAPRAREDLLQAAAAVTAAAWAVNA